MCILINVDNDEIYIYIIIQSGIISQRVKWHVPILFVKKQMLDRPAKAYIHCAIYIYFDWHLTNIQGGYLFSFSQSLTPINISPSFLSTTSILRKPLRLASMLPQPNLEVPYQVGPVTCVCENVYIRKSITMEELQLMANDILSHLLNVAGL